MTRRCFWPSARASTSAVLFLAMLNSAAGAPVGHGPAALVVEEELEMEEQELALEKKVLALKKKRHALKTATNDAATNGKAFDAAATDHAQDSRPKIRHNDPHTVSAAASCLDQTSRYNCCRRQTCSWIGTTDDDLTPCQAKSRLGKGDLKFIEDTCSDKDMSMDPADVAGKQLEANLNQITGSLDVGNLESGSSVVTTPDKLTALSPVPGADYLGVGYDIFYGNPDGDNKYMLDPGFRQPIRAMSYPSGARASSLCSS